jgi:pyridoxal phosphate enzyme (YggS family)
VSAGTSSDSAPDADRLRSAYQSVLARVADACSRVSRDPVGITIVAVSKTVGLERLRLAVEIGIATLGENRVQEAASKIPLLRGATWHLVGPLQSNKARRAVELFDVIETVDSVALARRLDRLAGEVRPRGRLPVLLEVNVDLDPAKTGFLAAEVEASLDDILGLPNLAVGGLMTVGRLVAAAEDARPTFRALRELSERLRDRRPDLGPELSMGMTDDFTVAVEEGATIVRIGRAIFGERPSNGPVDSGA